MPVTQADLVLKRSKSVSDDPNTNGGAISNTSVGTSIFPDVSGTERTSGITRWRKMFMKNEAGTGVAPEKLKDPNLNLLETKIYLQNTSAGGDHFLMKKATAKNNFQADEFDTDWYGTGDLAEDVLADVLTLDVDCEVSGVLDGDVFQNGGIVFITDGTNKEYLQLDAVTGVSWVDNLATLYFPTTALQHNYTAVLSETADIFTSTSIGYSLAVMEVNAYANKRIKIVSGTGAGQKRRILSNTETTFTVEYPWLTGQEPDITSVYEVYLTQVCMCIDLEDLGCDYTTPTITGAGTFTPGITLYPIGCIDADWEMLFSDSSNYTLTAQTTETISFGAFNTANDLKPTNGGSYYFSIPHTAFGTDFTNGSSITFSTISSSGAVWVKEIVPPATSAHLANSIDVGASGDTI